MGKWTKWHLGDGTQRDLWAGPESVIGESDGLQAVLFTANSNFDPQSFMPLVAAAPELAECLREIVDDYEIYLAEDKGPASVKMERARALLARLEAE